MRTVKAGLTRALQWALRVYRLGVIRPAVGLALVAVSAVDTYRGDYAHATLALVWVVLLELTDPRRSAGVHVRRKR